MANPKLPKDVTDQTGMKRLRGGAIRDLKKAFKRASDKLYRRIVADLQPIAVERNAEVATRTYIYEMDPLRLAAYNNWIEEILYYEILGNPQGVWAQDWFMNRYFSMAYESGVAISLTDAQRIAVPAIVGPDIAAQMRALQVATILQTPQMQRRIRGVYGRAFNAMKDMTDTIRATLSGELARGMANGKNPRVIARSVRDKTNMELYRAERIARTEINRSYTDAYMDEHEDVNRTVYKGERVKMALMHISALIPGRTRPRHAGRHGKVVTRAEQEEWWNTGANRINCLCSVVTVLVNRKTGEPVDQSFVDEVKAQKESYF